MAVHIRLSRAGTSKVPFYRIVATDHRAPRGGKFLERLGTWDPRREVLVLDQSAAQAWLTKGAQPSAVVAKLLKRAAAATAGSVAGAAGAAPAGAAKPAGKAEPKAAGKTKKKG